MLFYCIRRDYETMNTKNITMFKHHDNTKFYGGSRIRSLAYSII